MNGCGGDLGLAGYAYWIGDWDVARGWLSSWRDEIDLGEQRFNFKGPRERH